MDFASLASTPECLLESVDTIKEYVSNLKMSVDQAFEMLNSNLDRVLSRCDDKTLEFVLLSRIGLEGIDCLGISQILRVHGCKSFYHKIKFINDVMCDLTMKICL